MEAILGPSASERTLCSRRIEALFSNEVIVLAYGTFNASQTQLQA